MNRQKAARIDSACNKRQRESEMPVGVDSPFASGQLSHIVDRHDISWHQAVQKIAAYTQSIESSHHKRAIYSFDITYASFYQQSDENF